MTMLNVSQGIDNNADGESNAPTVVLFGLQNGNIGAVELQRDEGVFLWEVDCSQEETKAPVSHIAVAQLKANSAESCIIVREDSSIEIYKFPSRPGHPAGLSEPTLVFEVREQETITGVTVGHITSAARKEILFSCYSGAIKSLVDRK